MCDCYRDKSTCHEKEREAKCRKAFSEKSAGYLVSQLCQIGRNQSIKLEIQVIETIMIPAWYSFFLFCLEDVTYTQLCFQGKIATEVTIPHPLPFPLGSTSRLRCR